MQIYFVRHGESEANLLREFSNRGYKHGLTSKGQQQALALTEKLKGLAVSGLWTSPLKRAVQTAEQLAAQFGVPAQMSDALREYDCGRLEGKSDADSWARYDALLVEWLQHGRAEQRIEGGESLLDMQARFVPFIEHLIQTYQYAPGALILVGHGGLYRCMLPLVFTNIDAAFTLSHHLDNTDSIVGKLQADQLICLTWSGQPV